MHRFFPRPPRKLIDGDIELIDSLHFGNASHTFQLPLRTLFKALEVPRGQSVAEIMPALQANDLGIVVRAQHVWFADAWENVMEVGDSLSAQCIMAGLSRDSTSTFRLEVAVFLRKHDSEARAGQKVLFARSLAVLVVTKDHNTARAAIPPGMLPLFMAPKEVPSDFRAPLFALPDLPRPTLASSDLPAPLISQLIVARFSDMDTNQHVNQSVYVAWCEDAVTTLRTTPPPASAFAAFLDPISSVAVDHCGQAVAHDVVQLRGFANDDGHSITFEMRNSSSPDGQVFCRCTFSFQRRSSGAPKL